MPQIPGVPDHAAPVERTPVSTYLKFAAQVFAAAVSALIAALVDDRIDFSEWINAGVLALGAVAVLGAGDLPAGVWRYTKPIVSVASAVLVLWQSLATDGMSTGEWLQLAVAALGALGVYAAPGPKVVEATRFNALQRGLGDAGLSNGPVA